MYDLRPYQVAPHKASLDFFNRKAPPPGILVAPTAFGKSVLIAHTANELEGSTLVLQPTKELLEQNYIKFISLGGRATIYSASMNQKQFSDTVYATIGSIKDIGEAFARRNFKNLIIDEAHMYPRESMPEEGKEPNSMLAKFLTTSGITKILGLTATPFKLQSNFDITGNRFSKLQMLTSRSKYGRLFEEIIHVTQIQEITAMNYWAKLTYEIHPYRRDNLEWNTMKADYTEQSMFDSFNSQGMGEKIIARCRDLQERRSVLIFVPTIEIAIRLAERIPGAAAVHSKMADADRDRIIRDFRAERIKYVVNVNILAVGFDQPWLDAIISARPSSSLAWVYQALGRGTRIWEGKEDCLIIDFAGNVERFGRIENIYFKKKKTWQVYGEGGILLTNLAMDQIGSVHDSPVSGVVLEFGKYKGKDLGQIPREYIEYMLRDFTWTDRNYYIKEACEQIMAAAPKT